MLNYHSPKPSTKYSYFHAVPKNILNRKPIRTVIYFHSNPGISDYKKLEEYVREREIPEVLNYCEKFLYNLLVPIHTFNLHQDDTDTSTDRPDLAVLKILEEYTWTMKLNSYITYPKVFLLGLQNNAVLANHFEVLHPDRVKAIAVGDCDYFMYPVSQFNSINLNYPLGTADISDLANNTFSPKTFSLIHHFIFENGAESQIDKNTDEKANLIRSMFGNSKYDRSLNFINFLKKIPINAIHKTYNANTPKQEILSDVFKFFETIIVPTQ